MESQGKHVTERYLHVKAIKNTKGYNTESSFSIRTTDPDFDLPGEMKRLNALGAVLEVDAIRIRELETAMAESAIKEGE